MPRRTASQNSTSARHQNRDAAVPVLVREYLSRRELLAMVPLSMSSIDSLEKAGLFPSRFVLAPTTKVCWKRREVLRFLEQRAANRVHGARNTSDQSADDLPTKPWSTDK
jgi:predicted DNA-binding transcriptional regulator AlpA